MDYDDAPVHDTPEMDAATRQTAMFLHLSTLAGYIVPLGGLIVPIVIWQMKKDEMPEIDRHGKMVMNFLISFFLWSIVGFLLVFILIGIPVLAVLGILAVIFPIIGGIKANEGRLWKYPMTIEFLK